MAEDKKIVAPKIDESEAADLAELFRALGDASRVLIIAALVEGDQGVNVLAERVKISESATSHHLRHLRQMRLVRATKDGRHVFYSLSDEHVRDLFLSGVDHVRNG